MSENLYSKIDVANGCFISQEDVEKRKAVGKGLWGLYFEKVEKINDSKLRRDLSEKAQNKSIVPSYDLFKGTISLDDYRALITNGQKVL